MSCFLRNGAVLVVDDEEDVRDLVAMVLVDSGLPVLCAADGQAAAELLRGGAEVGVALLDVRMPGLDGPGTLALLREVQPDLRCCFLTGDTAPYAVPDLLALGVGAVFSKPFEVDELVRGVREALEGDGASSQPIVPV